MAIKHSAIWRFISSVKLAIWLIMIIAVFSLIGTFIPQNQEPQFYIVKFGEYGYQALAKTGLADIYGSWWFILSLVLLAFNLTFCLLNRVSLKKRSLDSFLTHLGVLVILSGALMGMFYSQKGYLKINESERINSFTARNKQVDLGFSVRLDDFIYNENISPQEKLSVYALANESVCRINDTGEKSKNKPPLAEIPMNIGSEVNIADTGYKVKILRYLPDFVMDTSTKQASNRSAKPNNPALELKLNDKDGFVKTIWVFARYPDLHRGEDEKFKFVYTWAARRPKDFISKITVIKDGKEILNHDIRVNYPLRFGGYTFFQTNYDPENLSWSGLQVVKDPGVPVIYTGFTMLILGLIMIFYVTPLTRNPH